MHCAYNVLLTNSVYVLCLQCSQWFVYVPNCLFCQWLCQGRHQLLSGDGVATILHNLNSEVHAQSLTAGDRRHMYSLVTFFLQQRLTGRTVKEKVR